MLTVRFVVVIAMWGGSLAWNVQPLRHPLWRGFVTVGTGLTLSSLALDFDTFGQYTSFVNVVSADSTGKVIHWNVINLPLQVALTPCVSSVQH